MIRIFVLFALIVFSVPTFAATRYVTTSTPMRNNYYRPPIGSYNRPVHPFNNRYHRPVPYPNRNYNRYMNYNNNGIRTFYPDSTTVVTSNNSTSKLGNFFNNIKSGFIGTPTGLTPPVNPYYSYGSNSYGTNYGDYQDYYGNRGWIMNNKQIGSGGGVHIID